MKGLPNCPQCGGRGVVLPPDPLAAARVCACAAKAQGQRSLEGLPARYREASLDRFWTWWCAQHQAESFEARLRDAQKLLDHAFSRDTLPRELALQLDHILRKCGPAKGAPDYKALRPALQPTGLDGLQDWAEKGTRQVDHWWISGPANSGRSSLAAAALMAWSRRTGTPGLFVSIRTLSQELKDVYYDIRSFRNADFRSERDIVAPLIAAPMLVLDDFDRLEGDTRVAKSVAELLDRRYAELRPTVLTAVRTPKLLTEAEGHPFCKGEDGSLVRRLLNAQRVELRPTLETLLDAVKVA